MNAEINVILAEALVLRKAGERELPPDHPRTQLSFGKRKRAEVAKLRAVLETGEWWWVWDCPSVKSFYHIGYVRGTEQEAIKLAKKTWPQREGRMRLEPLFQKIQRPNKVLRKVKGKLVWIGNNE